MSSKEESKVSVRSDVFTEGDFENKPMTETSQIIDCTDGVDVYLAMGNFRHQLAKKKSPYHEGDEFVYRGVLEKGSKICFVHKDGRKIPVNDSFNCGYTLVGKAKKYFEARKALCANGEDSDDQIYVYINQNSALYYIGESEEHTIFIRIYDNQNGLENDRWVVMYME